MMLVLPRLPEWWLVSVACMRTGAVMIPGISQLTEKDLKFRLQASRAKAIITSDSLAPRVDAISADCPSLQTKLLVSDSYRPGWMNFRELLWEASTEHNCARTRSQDPVAIYFTSGTTGTPKMVEHTQASYGLGFVASGRYQFQSLRHCVTGGEALTPDVREKWKSQTGLELHEGYGQSETVLICANPKGMKIKSGSMGKASPPYDVQVVDEEGNILPPGEEGNVAIRVRPTRPFCFFTCYLDNPEKTAASEQGDFYITGDRAHMDKDGYFWFMGRNDDVINSSSYRIGPVEVESALAEHPAVLESAVVSSPDPIRGERDTVGRYKHFGVNWTWNWIQKGLLDEDVGGRCRLCHSPCPIKGPFPFADESIVSTPNMVTAGCDLLGIANLRDDKMAFVSELPKTVSGKIQRSKLRRQEWENEKQPQKGLNMYWRRQLQALCILWRSQMSNHTIRIHTRQLASLQWGHQEVPAKFNFATDVIDHWAGMEKAGKRPPGPALWWVSGNGDEVMWNFSQLSELSQQTANVFAGPCGLQRGDRVTVVLSRVPEWWLVILGCMRAGLVFMPGTIQMKAKDILYRLQVSNARAIVAGDEVAEIVDTVAPECPSLKTKLLVSEKSRDGWLDFRTLLWKASTTHCFVETGSQEAAAIYFTSGTSGLPKMAEHSHSSLGLKAKMDAGKWTDLQASDIIWPISDTAWIVNILGSLLEPWTSGACTFIHLLPKFDPVIILKVLSSYPINYMIGAPLVYRMLLLQDLSSYKFPHLKCCFSGGETLLPDTLEKWKIQTGLDILEFYGQTETGLTCRVSKTMKIKPGYLGTAIPHYDVQVIDEKGNVLPPGTEGDVGIRVKPIRPIGIFSGYVDNIEKTEANIRGDFWVLGDRAIKDQDGYFRFMGRTDDIINSSGYRIGPSEVENALMEHPAVVETAVVSSPDPIRGEVVKAFVVLAPHFLSHDPDELTKELQQHVKSVTAPYKYPRKIEFVLDLPKTNTGKVQRAKLRDKEWKKSEQVEV
ncbi:hypothetical protein MG293_018172 [Ovis ammon polii]|uniref:medium-chain acyl-CoA ligase n=1 Tax=Ovis ammon polii TaxID=230172 RepID=A0AAD4Y1W8_OVIAM|nr:hypothetical protein MG293_018172 [Ovis ammon polii]